MSVYSLYSDNEAFSADTNTVIRSFNKYKQDLLYGNISHKLRYKSYLVSWFNFVVDKRKDKKEKHFCSILNMLHFGRYNQILFQQLIKALELQRIKF